MTFAETVFASSWERPIWSLKRSTNRHLHKRFASCLAAIVCFFLAKDALDWPPDGKKCASGGCLALNGRKSSGGNFVSTSSDGCRERCHLILSVHQVEPGLPCQVVVIRWRFFYWTSPCISTFFTTSPATSSSFAFVHWTAMAEWNARLGEMVQRADHHFISVIFIWLYVWHVSAARGAS